MTDWMVRHDFAKVEDDIPGAIDAKLQFGGARGAQVPSCGGRAAMSTPSGAGRHPGDRGRHLISGPFAGRLLGDMGAEVIKIEPPGSPDPVRTWGRPNSTGTTFWTVHAATTKAVTLNLREPAGRELFLKLVERSDIIVENFRPAPWRSGTWAMTFCANTTRASSWGCPATARPGRTPTRRATRRWPRPRAGCGT